MSGCTVSSGNNDLLVIVLVCSALVVQVNKIDAAAAAAAATSPSTDARIINGHVASAEQTKFQVSIRLKQFDAPFGSGHICGGSLIGPNKVLTAAHCLYNTEKKRFRKANEFLVVMGTLNRYQRTNGTIVSDVRSIAYMNTFSLDTMRDDVGLMFLRHGLPPNRTHRTVAPVEMSIEPLSVGISCQVSGWGKTEVGTLSTQLLYTNVSTLPLAICRRSYGDGLISGMVCAGVLKGGTDSCQGDSGGPLICENRQVGVVSWGTGCAEPMYPGVYSDIAYYHHWIQSRNGALATTLYGVGARWCLLLSVVTCLWPYMRNFNFTNKNTA